MIFSISICIKDEIKNAKKSLFYYELVSRNTHRYDYSQILESARLVFTGLKFQMTRGQNE